ncbi:MAG TPA: M1 family aminopeptidase [Ignavibacteriales bacterium]|nr:M1 family aminopeptidase [Ignavibacteriales bacterium]
MTKRKLKAFQVASIVFFNSLLFISWTIHYEPVKSLLSGAPFLQLYVQYRLSQQDSMESYITPAQNKIDVTHYDINIDLFPEKKIIKGDVTLTGVLLDRSLKKLDLNFYENMSVKQLTLNGKPTEFEQKETRLSIPLNSFNADTFNLRVVYEGTPKSLGFGSFNFSSFSNRPVVYTLSEPIYASTWYPCNDKPDDKALMDMRITNDSSKVSVSNGHLMDVKTVGQRRTYHWKTFYPITTYLICIYSADYRHFDEKYVSERKDTMNIDYFAFPEHLDMAETDFSGHPEMIRFFSGLFGEYPFIKEKYGVAEFLWQMGAMEHQTITGIGSNFLNGRRFFNEFYIHELAHQWFGDAVSPATWKDIWLNEGFASYCEALYAEHESGVSAYRSTMLQKFHDRFSGTLYNPESGLFSSTVYDKGAWVLHMLRWELGDSVFFSSLKKYYETFKYKNAATRDFINVCQNESHKDLSYFFKQWVFEGEDNIRILYSWTDKAAENNSHLLTLNIMQEQSSPKTFRFPLEVEIKLIGQEREIRRTFYVTSSQQSFHLKLDSPVQGITMDPDGWLLASFKKEE